jgi:hypothetical protein
MMSEEDLVFMINVSEHVQKPNDMLMFLGEYFKKHIGLCLKIDDDSKKDDHKANKELGSYYITDDILNQLGSACKMFIEKPRQQLRISIALSRKPVFSKTPETPNQAVKDLETDELIALRQSITDCQLYIIDQCTKIYKFIDYLHDRRLNVKLKNIGAQPPKNEINATLYKMKADYLRYIFECLGGDDGLLIS